MKRRRRNRWLVRGSALTLALMLVIPIRTLATTIDQVQQRQEELKEENESLQEKIDALKNDKEAALAYQAELTDKIDETEEQIDQARETIDEMNVKIGGLEEKLSLSKEEYQDTIDLFRERLRTMYVSGGTSVGTLEMLLSAESLSDFIMMQKLMEVTAQHDQALLDKIDEYVEKTQDDREALMAAQQEVADFKKAIESAQEELEVLYAENDALVVSLETQQEDAQEQIQQNEAEDAELQAQLQQLIEERNREEQAKKEQAALEQNTGEDQTETSDQGEEEQNNSETEPPSNNTNVEPVTPGLQSGFSPMWPLPGVGVGSISGHFGDMYFNGPHNGLDIAAGYGTPIVAAQAGEVIQAQYHWSWGNNVLIWHNETYATRYAHCSSLAVSPGQYVEQGQIIGYVGSTGESSGNHLHFEVYYNGVRVDPDPYLGI